MIVEIDVRSLAPSALAVPLDESAAKAILRDIADAARAKWVSLAHEHLRRTEQDYVRGIQPVEMNVGEGIAVASITLLGVWPNMLEAGFGPYDMRDTLLGVGIPTVPRGARGKHAAKGGGFYRTIAFRMTGPRATGRNAQKVTEVYAKQLGEDRAKQLGKIAWEAMRQLSPTRSNPGEKTQWGERMRVTGPDRTPGTDGLNVKGRSHKLIKNDDGTKTLVKHGGKEHAVPLFEGAMRHEQTYKRATQSFYGTMRTISTNQPEGWIHPGFRGASLLPEVEHYIRRVAPGMVEAAVRRMAKGPSGV